MDRDRSRALIFTLAICLSPAAAFAEGAATEIEMTTEASTQAEGKEGSGMVEKGKQVSIEYTLTLEDGSKIDTNVGGEPLTFEQGAGQIVPGLEEELSGMQEGETKKVTVGPEKAYGTVNPDAFQEVESEKVPEEARKEGMMLLARDAQGQGRQVRVHEVKDDSVVIDFNHPLAGKTLTFDVKVLDVK